MGRSVSYPSAAQVVTFSTLEQVDCYDCDGREGLECDACNGTGKVEPDSDDFDQTIDDFRDHLAYLFPSVTVEDRWLGNEDHVLAENRHARFGISEYCGLVAYWIVPKADYVDNPLAVHWIASIEAKFVKAFGQLTKVGSMSNGEGVYRAI